MYNDNIKYIKLAQKCNEEAMKYWALQYVNYIEVISPEHLRNKIRDFLKIGLDKYSK